METTANHPPLSPNPPIYDVIIAGAGPVGLFLAGELALAHCSVLLLEKAASPHSLLKQVPFGVRGLSAPTIEALDRRGLLQELTLHQRLKNPHQHAGQGAQRQVGHFAGLPFHAGAVDATQWPYRLPSSPPTSLMAELEELETVLAHRAETLGVVIRRGVAITSLQQTEHGVTVQGSGETFAAHWLVGCDGGRSVVRKVGGFDFVGTEPEFTGYTVQADLADPEKLLPGRNLTTAGMYLQSQPGYLVLQDFDGGAAHQPGQPITREQVQQVLRRISSTDVTIRALHAATTWTDRARQASTYRHGRVLLAGDAAHVHAPLGGQGLNLGIGDALNLGWKLAATVHGQGPANLLDSYTTERHPIGAQVLDWSRAQVALMRPEPAARALQAVFRDLLATRDGATYVAGRVWGIHLQYPLAGENPLTGHSVPNFAFDDGSTVDELLRDGRGLLLDFDGDVSLQALAQATGPQVHYVARRPQNALGLRAALVRPDGIVAWATGHAHTASEAQAAVARWFTK
ncbi:FAD-dependent monooxygenase [Hymenobacter sp. DH14]|uniref:FAD-dependent monooxygenase n=1 Tax=Hymenobacter cyanobacteriorum TaxID=2926463 RepID=A0A9X1VEP6_9BACT|nr:FAD-dependent monooxygenase [Hymenobacter cyanobacteriorum]MCI1187784.1 FAD-dependent monooxygenase [Hymenobacter cyanobacteriorum]